MSSKTIRKTRRPRRPSAFPKITCEKHGKSDSVVVCKHLSEKTGVGYYALGPAPGRPFTQAWCVTCHAALVAEGGWSDRARAVAGLRIICTSCYRDVIGHQTRLVLGA